MVSIKDIWFGNLEPQLFTDEEAEEADAYAIKVHECFKKLDAQISDEKRELLTEYLEAFEEYCCFLEASAFESGFRLALQLVMASMK